MRTRFISFAVLCLASACVTNPVTHNSELATVSQSGEIKMGRDVDRYLVATRRFYDDSAWERYVQQLGLRLAAKCERPELPWTFRVLDDPGVNAFALPGGFVYVTRGMLVYLNSEAQLAAVLGHEVGHVAARHAVGQRTRQEMAGLGLMVATVAGSMTAGYAGSAGLQVLFLANSRAAEQQADELGLRYMSDAGYDPTEMQAALRTIERVVEAGRLPGWLATHPTWERRLENIQLERGVLQSSGTRVERDAYLAHLNRLAFGIDERQGYFKGSRFAVPARGYQVTFPRGWLRSSDGAAVRVESLAQDAVVELTTTEQPSVDSASRFFFAKLAKLEGSPTHDQINGFTVVSASFTWLPLWVKMRGSVKFIEHRGTVYRVMGYARSSRWSAYREVVESALGTFELIPEAELQRAEPLRVATLSLAGPTSLTALAKARPSPVELTELAGLNQVAPDSVLPAGRVIKWVVGTLYH